MPTIFVDGIEYIPKETKDKERDLADAFPLGRIVKITGTSASNGGVGSYGIVCGYEPEWDYIAVHVPTATEESCHGLLDEGHFGWWVASKDLELMP